MADGLFRILFQDSNCLADDDVKKALQNLFEQGLLWIWKDGKDGYEAFLKNLEYKDGEEVLEEGSLHEASVFEAQAGFRNAANDLLDTSATPWKEAYVRYLSSSYMYEIYSTTRDLREGYGLPSRSQCEYPMGPTQELLPCIPKSKVLPIFEQSMIKGDIGISRLRFLS